MKNQQTELLYCSVSSPLGELLIMGSEKAVHCLAFQSSAPIVPDPSWRESGAAFRRAKEQLAAYFAGALREFTLPLEPAGTPFQCRVWDELRRVPYGTTVSYAEIAGAIGSPNAVRAVGAANGANPIPIIIPCHRVIGSSGALTGYRGGLAFKQYLLELELRFSESADTASRVWSAERAC